MEVAVAASAGLSIIRAADLVIAEFLLKVMCPPGWLLLQGHMLADEAFLCFLITQQSRQQRLRREKTRFTDRSWGHHTTGVSDVGDWHRYRQMSHSVNSECWRSYGAAAERRETDHSHCCVLLPNAPRSMPSANTHRGHMVPFLCIGSRLLCTALGLFFFLWTAITCHKRRKILLL